MGWEASSVLGAAWGGAEVNCIFAKGDDYGLPAPKRQAVLVLQLDFAASSRAEAGVVWHKGSGSSTSLRGALSPALPAASVLNQVIKPSQVKSKPLPIPKPQVLYGSTEGEYGA